MKWALISMAIDREEKYKKRIYQPVRNKTYILLLLSYLMVRHNQIHRIHYKCHLIVFHFILILMICIGFYKILINIFVQNKLFSGNKWGAISTSVHTIRRRD